MKRMSINWKLYWVRLVSNDGELIVMEHFSKVFDNEYHINLFIDNYRTSFEKLFGIKLKTDPFYQQVPKEEYILEVVGLVAIHLSLPRESILSKLKDRDLAYARKMISYLCLELKLTPTQIGKKTGFRRDDVYAHKKSLDILMEVDKDLKKQYTALRDKILPMYTDDKS